MGGALPAELRRDRGFPAPDGNVSSILILRGRPVRRLRDTKAVLDMMRPDHIYFAMAMVKHSTLAGACIFAAKLVYFMVKASA